MKSKNLKIIIGMLLLIILIISGIILLYKDIVINKNSIINNILEKSDDFSKYYSDQCPDGEIMSWWYSYPNGSIKVNGCTKPFSCSKGKKLVGHCSPLIEYDSCKVSCLGDYDNIPAGF